MNTVKDNIALYDLEMERNTLRVDVYNQEQTIKQLKDMLKAANNKLGRVQFLLEAGRTVSALALINNIKR